MAADGREMIAGSALAIAEINARGGVGGRRVEQIVVDIDPGDEASVILALESLGRRRSTRSPAAGSTPSRRLSTPGAERMPYLNAFTSENVAALVRNDPTRYGSVFQVCATRRGTAPVSSARSTRLSQMVGGNRVAAAFCSSSSRRSLRGWPRRRRLLPPSVRDGRSTASTRSRPRSRAGTPARAHPGLRSCSRDADSPGTRGGSCIPAAVRRPSHRRARVPRVLTVDPAFLEHAGTAAEGVLWSTVTGSYGDAIGTGFVQRFERAFGRRPGRSYAGIAYDEVHVLAGAWTCVGNPRRFSQVADDLARVPYRGSTGCTTWEGRPTARSPTPAPLATRPSVRHTSCCRCRTVRTGCSCPTCTPRRASARHRG